MGWRVGILTVAVMAFTTGGLAWSQGPQRPIDPTEGTYRADNLGIEYRLVPHDGHFAAKLTRVVAPKAPVYFVRLPEGMFQIEVGDLITRLDDMVFQGSQDVLGHVAETTVDFIDSRTGLAHRGTMTLPPVMTTSRATPIDASKKLRALLVVDTASGLDGIDKDRQAMRSILVNFERQGRAEVTVLQSPRDVNRDRIIAYFRSQPEASSDTVLFYYSGHGGTDPKAGHYLAPTGGPGLLRSDLRREIARLRPRLSVLLTDCCSNSVPLPPYPGATMPRNELAEDLFFRARGAVDLTAATYDAVTGEGESGWGDQSGGFFTSSLASTLRYGEKAQLDTSRDGLVSWAEFFPSLVDATSGKFKQYRFRALGEDGRDIHPDVRQSLRIQADQRPQMFR